MGQPKNGNRDTVRNLTVKDLQSHQERTYIGKNFGVVVTGDCSHDQVVKISTEWL